MPVLPDIRARVPAARTCAGLLAGALTLALAIAPLGAQPAPEAPEDPPADQPATDEAPEARPATDEAPEARPVTDEAPEAAVAPATPAVPEVSARRSFAWIAIGAAAALATTSAVLALAVESREDDMQFLIDFRAPGIGVPNRYDGEVRDRYEELAGEAETLSRYSWITLGLAGVAVASATALFLLDRAGAPADAPAPALGQVAPAPLPGGLGITLDWEF